MNTVPVREGEVFVSLVTSPHSKPGDNSFPQEKQPRVFLCCRHHIQTENTQTPMTGSEWKAANSSQSRIIDAPQWWCHTGVPLFKLTEHDYAASKPRPSLGCGKVFLLFWITTLHLSCVRLSRIPTMLLKQPQVRDGVWLWKPAELLTEVKEPSPGSDKLHQRAAPVSFLSVL